MIMFDETMNKISKANIYLLTQSNQANLIDISILRNQINGNRSLAFCQDFLKKLDLEQFFSALNSPHYVDWLDKITDNFVGSVSNIECLNASKQAIKIGLKWGSARKTLNLFFIRICNNAMMREKYLSNVIDIITNKSILNKLELPVDSKVANSIMEFNNGLKKETKKDLSSILSKD